MYLTFGKHIWTKYHGVLAANSKHRVLVTPHGGKGDNKKIAHEVQEKTAFTKKRGESVQNSVSG